MAVRPPVIGATSRRIHRRATTSPVAGRDGVRHRRGASRPSARLRGGRRSAFRGDADRVDRDPDGAMVVTDYKTGRTAATSKLERDPVDRGRRLQLPIYGLAAQAPLRGDGPAAHRVLVRLRHAAASTRSATTSTTAVPDGSCRGRRRSPTASPAATFPGRPGEPDRPASPSWDNCRYCEFDRDLPDRPGRAVAEQRERRPSWPPTSRWPRATPSRAPDGDGAPTDAATG